MTTSDLAAWTQARQDRIAHVLAGLLPDPAIAPTRLHEAMRYAVLLRLKSFTPATIVDVATFDGGAAVFEAFLLDLGSGRLLAGCTVTAEPDATVNFKHPADATQDQIDKTLLANAEATMSLDAMRKLSACLTEKTGGAFKLN